MNALKKQRFLGRLENTLSSIDAELVRAKSTSNPKIRDDLLITMKKSLVKLRDELKAGHMPRPNTPERLLTRVIVDSWPFGTPLGKSIVELEQEFHSLQK